MSNPFDLDGRVIVVTGAMGQLGREFCRELAGRGARVAALDRAAGEAASRAAIDPGAGRLLEVQADVTSRESLDAALRRIAADLGVPHGLVNAAALDSPPGAPAEENGPLETYPERAWDRVMDVNLKGTLLCGQVFGGAMAEAGRGAIVNISSTYGVVSPDQRLYDYRREAGAPFFKPIAYSASKSALLNVTRYMATYWAPRNVRVNTVTFGGVFNGQDERFLAGYAARVPLGRMARPDEYNGAIVFLLSDASSYMTGSNLVIDGGWTAW
ncbi:MAG: SDR family oxidoreductase [Acidobacteria bacterium]|nr:SDR family oxidoreductase [Acidobacteriota bacterium]